MALDNFEDIFKCDVCYDYMLDKFPRTLPSLHTFCENCLKNLLNNYRIKCPECRKVAWFSKNDVKQIPINFLLKQMRDILESRESDKTFCQMCRESSPGFKCVQCSRLLFNECEQIHCQIKKYKGHSVYPYCKKHEDSMTRICTKCYIPLCKTCMAIDHKHHAGHFKKYGTSAGVVQEEAGTLWNTVNESEIKLDRNLRVALNVNKGTDSLKEDLIKRREYHLQKISESDEHLKVIKKTKMTLSKVEKHYKKAKDKCRQCKQSLQDFMEGGSRSTMEFLQVKQNTENTINLIKKSLTIECSVPPFTVSDSSSESLVTYHRKIKNLTKSQTLICINQAGRLGRLKQLASFGDHILAVTENKPSHVIRLDSEGNVKDRYYPDVESEVTSVDVYQDQIYILQEHTITVMSPKERKKKAYKPRISNMGKMLVIDDSNIIITEYTSEGCVHLYNVKTDHTETVVEGLKYPSYISMAHTGHRTYYLITEYEAHCVRVYTDSWKLLYTIGEPFELGSLDGFLKWPLATAVTSQNTVLVADQYNDRICHFTLDGRFLSDVLTAVDSVWYPVGVLYKNNVLWVCGLFRGDIKCFELTYN